MKKRLFTGILAVFLSFTVVFSMNTLNAAQDFPEFTDGTDSEEEMPMYKETLPEYNEIDIENAGSFMDSSEDFAFFASPFRLSGESWRFDAYYVNQEDPYEVKKTGDFSLKYQYDFHTDRNLEANTIEIRFPAILLTDRLGNAIFPSDIGVPFGFPQDGGYTWLPNSPFNCFTEDGDLVFFNYRPVSAGTNAAVQVLYKNLKVLDLIDQSAWELLPRISVFTEEGREEKQGTPLRGTVDTEVTLLNVSKTALKEPERNYTPGLYTKEQVKQYLSELPQEYEEHFSDYVYVLWKTSYAGTADQAWELYLSEIPEYTNGSLTKTGTAVGIQVHTLSPGGGFLKTLTPVPAAEGPYSGQYLLADYLHDFPNRNDFRLEAYIVTAYPQKEVTEGTTVFNNRITALLHPADGIDEDQSLNAEAKWSWMDYRWNYSGDTISVTKNTGKNTYTGWLDTYVQAQINGHDLGDFSFHVKGDARIYGFTHQIQTPSPGQYTEGNYCEITTADDVLYAYPQTRSNAREKFMLDDRDYYFSGVSVIQQDQGYDLFEDKPDQPETVSSDIDRSLRVYAMFAGNSQWEEAGSVPWNPSGRLEFTCPKEILARQPWRIKAVHNSIDYQSGCDIQVTVKLRRDSPVLGLLNKEKLTENRTDLVRLENLCAITGRAFSDSDRTGMYFHDRSTAGALYQESGLIKKTQELYGVIAMRDCQLIDLSALEKHAQAQKYARAVNDPEHQRIRIQYTVSAYESYRVYSEDALFYLQNKGLLSPGRETAVFYDLLPYGVQFDPSEPISAGRLTGVSETHLSRPSVWDTEEVSVYVDSDTDIIRDFRGTGRTLVKFHVSCHPKSPSVFAEGFWLGGYGISFAAYCSYEDIKKAGQVPNICAFMPENGDFQPILGKDDEVSFDNGVIVSAVNTEDYRPFGPDINDDGITDIRNVLYCRAAAFEDIAAASESGIQKTVRAEDDRFGVFGQSASVGAGDSYIYNITVTNTSPQAIKNLVIFDRLENAGADRREEESDMLFEEIWWTGIFKKINLSMAEELGISPVVYFHGDRTESPVPSGNTDPALILTEENGWYTSDLWPGTAAEVQAVAVDLSRNQDGSEFLLENMESVSFYLSMDAPTQTADARYAYNNSGFSSLTTGADDTEAVRQTVWGNSVKVRLDNRQILEVRKEFDENVPENRQKESFLFTALSVNEESSKRPYSSREYSLYKRNGSSWQKQDGLFATDAGGKFRLKAGEKAVFKEAAGVSGLEITEEENPFWKSAVSENLTETTRTLLFTNEYRPVLYLQKKITAFPKDREPFEGAFGVQVLCNGQPLAEQEFWYVDKAASYGFIPQKLGTGCTDAEGKSTIHPGEILAFFPGNPGDSYEITEQADSYGPGTDWIGSRISAKGILSLNGNSEILENIYKWKDLYLLKNIKNRDAGSCTETFCFRVYEKLCEEPLSGLSWELLDSEKKPLIPPVTGVSGEDGKICCACAGKLIRIRNLEAGKAYRIQEVDIPEAYSPENNGSAEAVMPVYSSESRTEITNQWLFRDLKVSKLVILPNDRTGESPGSHLFEMTLLVKNGEVFIPKADFPYEVRKNGVLLRQDKTDTEGHFYLSDLETAEFRELALEGTAYQILETPDEYFPPVYPSEGIPEEGTLGKNTVSVLMINGSPGCLAIRKEYISSEKDTEAEKLLQSDSFLKESFLNAGFSIELNRGNGYENFEGTVMIVENTTGEIHYSDCDSENNLVLRNNQTAVLTGLEETVQFRIRETERHKTLLYGDDFLILDQFLPENDKPFSGHIGKGTGVLFVNRLHLFPSASSIYKQMTPDSAALPDQALLVYRVEQYRSSGWYPAADIRYIVNYHSGSNICMETETDGLIRLSAEHSVFPSVHFEQKVYVNPKPAPIPGTLRITEVPELSDESLGILTGYSTHEYYSLTSSQVPVSFDIPPELADTFVNSNVLKPADVEKLLRSETSGQDFLMEIRSLGGSGYAGSQVKCLSYSVYNSLTGEKLYTSKTSDNGEFTLKAGQFARFLLCTGSAWQIFEKLPYPYRLESVSGNSPSVQIRSDNSVNIYLNSNPQSSFLTREMIDCGVYDPKTGKRINLTEGSVVIPSEVLYNGKLHLLCGIDDGAYNGFSELMEITVSEGFTRLGQHAFYGCTNLKKIQLPSTLTEIDSFAFYNCSSLESISIPKKVNKLSGYLFSECSSLKEIELPPGLDTISTCLFQNCVSLREIAIPKGVVKIDANAFAGCMKLEDIFLPDTVREIKNGVFTNCESLKTLSLPEELQTISENVFVNCRSLSRLSIPRSVSSLGSNAFSGCSNLKEIQLSEGLTKIYSYVFYDCTQLLKIVIPKSVRTIDSSAFNGCIHLEEIYVEQEEDSIANAPWGAECPVYWKGQEPEETPVSGKWDAEDEHFYYKISANGYLLAHCKDPQIQSAVIPETVNGKPVLRLGTGAFQCCKNLKSVSIPEGIKYIDEFCFFDCTGLEEICLPESLWYLGNYAFSGSGIRSIRISAEITGFGEYIFRSCRNLEQAVLEKGLTKLGNGMFQDCTALNNLSLPEGFSLLPFRLCSGCISLNKITVPESVTRLDRYAFSGTGLEELSLPDSITFIGEYCFESCRKLKSVRLPKNLTTLNTSLFRECSSLEHITLPENLNIIGSSAFCSCSALKEFTISPSVTSISSNNFENCRKLVRINIQKPPGSLAGAPWSAPNKTLMIRWTKKII